MYRDRALMRRLGLALPLAAACHHGSASPAPAIAVRFAASNPRRCIPLESAAPADTLTARLCAEAFVLQNGYTPVRAPRDTALLVREPFEVGSWDLLTERRRYSVEPHALLAECDKRGCIVFFRRFRRRSQGCLAASMSPDYGELQFGRPVETELLRSGARSRCY